MLFSSANTNVIAECRIKTCYCYILNSKSRHVYSNVSMFQVLIKRQKIAFSLFNYYYILFAISTKSAAKRRTCEDKIL